MSFILSLHWKKYFFENILPCIFIVFFAIVPYLNSLHGKFTYDDKVAVAGNPDVYRENVSFTDLLIHDFWGNQLNARNGYGWTHHSWRPLVVASFRYDQFRGYGNVFSYHITNIILYVFSCVSAWIFFRCLQPSTNNGHWRAFLCAIFFTLHPIHSECVANITSRADTFASIFQFAALSVYLYNVPSISSCINNPTILLQMNVAEDAIDIHKTKNYRRKCTLINYRSVYQGIKVFGICLLYLSLLFLGIACKETTLIIPFLCIVIEIATTIARTFSIKLHHESNKLKLSFFYNLKHWIITFCTYFPWIRACTLFCLGICIYYIRIIVIAKGYTLSTWANPIHNSLFHTHDYKERFLSIALVQAFAFSKLVFPYYLSHEHNALQHVSSILDVRNTLTIIVWIAIILLIMQAIQLLINGHYETNDALLRKKIRRGTMLLLGIGLILISYAPYSHLLQYVAFVLAERTLFIPSIGASIVIAETWYWLYDIASVLQTHLSSIASFHIWNSFIKLRIFILFFMFVHLTFFGARIWYRNMDWVDEESLMNSNLRIYPTGNTMTIYGLGAVSLYKGDIDKAEEYLVRACQESTMVEPHILLSQLYWKHRITSYGMNAIDKALYELELVANTNTPRKEILTNLGMLQLGKAHINNETEMKIAEANILTAQIAHGYPTNHHALALLASNAACIRFTSTATRYGNAFLAEKLLIEALSIIRNEANFGTGAVYRNAVVFYAVQGYILHALSLLQEGLNVTSKKIYEAEFSMTKQSGIDTSYIIRTAKSNIAYYKDTYRALQRLLITIQSHAAIITSWSMTNGPVIGEDVERRMTYLGVECYMEMLWW